MLSHNITTQAILVTRSIKIQMLEITHEVVCEYNIMHGIEAWACGEARSEFGKIHSRLCKKIMGVPHCTANRFAEN